MPQGDQETLRELAGTLAGEVRKCAPLVGLDVGRLNAAEVELGAITVAEGTGARIGEANVPGTFRTGDIAVGPPPGKR